MQTVAMNRVVILAGGRGSRMGEQTDVIPKPMVKIGDKPIIEHIMDMFNRRVGNCEFVIAGGYKQQIIREYFKNDKNVLVLDTGIETQTAGRLLILRNQIDFDSPFFMCYGDGVTDFNVSLLRTLPGIINMLAVHPIGRFGEIKFSGTGRVIEFLEKPIQDRWINGGYFYLQPSIFSYIHAEDDVLETGVMLDCLNNDELYCYPYSGYWHCMDTPKDVTELNYQYYNGDAAWLKS